jgi:D-lactate dehydrogenase (cytochrome)
VISETQADIDASGIPSPLLGHVGDGNFHATFLIDSDSKEEHETVKRIHRKMVLRALEAEGTCTGEHGVGVGKMVSTPALICFFLT